METDFFTAYLGRLENLQRSIEQETQGLPEEAIDWVPGPEMSSLGVLLAHVTGALRYWIGDMVLQEPSGRVREREFQTRGVPAAELLRQLAALLDYLRSALPRLRLEDLSRDCQTAEGKSIPCAEALLRALDHAYLHLGHIQLTGQLWRQKAGAVK